MLNVLGLSEPPGAKCVGALLERERSLAPARLCCAVRGASCAQPLHTSCARRCPPPPPQETVAELECAKLDHVIDVACRSDPEAMQKQAEAATKCVAVPSG